MPDKVDPQLQQGHTKAEQTPAKDMPAVEKAGPGLTAAQGLLAKGEADPKKYARVIREYPADKGAILGAVQGSPLGNSFAQSVAKELEGLDLSIEDKRLSYVGDENYFVADQKRKGAEFQVGDAHGTVDKEGLKVEHPAGDGAKVVGTLGQNKDTKHVDLNVDHVRGDTTVGAKVHADPKGVSSDHGADIHGKTKVGKGTGDAKLGYERQGDKPYAVGEVGYKDKDKDARLKGKYGGADNLDVSLGGSKKIDDTRYRGNVGYGVKDGADTVRGGVGLTTDKGVSADLKGRYTDGDNYQADLTGSKKIDGGASVYGGVGYGEKDGTGTLTGKLGHRDKDSHSLLSGLYTDENNYGLNLSHDQKHSAHLNTQSKLGYNMSGGEGALTGSLRGQYDSDDFVASGGLGAQMDSHGLGYNADASLTGTLSPGSAYLEGFGGVKGGGDLNEPTYHMGGGLVLTPHEKLAMTISGAIDQNGGFDTRLQFDVFKKKVDNARGISNRKKESAVQVFMGYRQGMGGDVMNDQYGGGRFSHDEGQAYVGIGFKF